MASRRIEIGFHGGGVLRLTVSDETAAALPDSLDVGGWHEVASDEGSHWVEVGAIQYLRVVPGDVGPRVGFSGE
ncbi:MAG: hypothetical protein HYX33_04320 [Actinobacteria bacterium]|nr:hypothetical protein [Actinomycetota bacterium]